MSPVTLSSRADPARALVLVTMCLACLSASGAIAALLPSG
jgi:hypothetical protein